MASCVFIMPCMSALCDRAAALARPVVPLVNIMADLRLWSGEAGLEDDITLLCVDVTGEDPVDR